MASLDKDDIGVILLSLDNHLKYDKEINEIKKYALPVFRAEKRKETGLFGYYLNICKAVLFCVFPVCVPFFSRYLVRLGYFDDKSQDCMSFYSGSKSRTIINPGNDNTGSFIALLKIGARAKFKIRHIVSLYRLNWNFLAKYRKEKWFYGAAIWLPELIVFYFHLKNSNANCIKITNHYDRWAFIASSLCSNTNRSLILYQHGLVDGNFQPYNKLPLISKLYVYSASQYDLFKSNICNNIESYMVSSPKINLIEVDGGAVGVKTIFLVGHGDREVIRKLYWLAAELSAIDFVVLAKPHPAYTDIFYEYDWRAKNVKLVLSDGKFPNVDYVVHCASTLALEYEASSNKAICFDLSYMSESKVFEAVK